jgi:hypothetical protein
MHTENIPCVVASVRKIYNHYWISVSQKTTDMFHWEIRIRKSKKDRIHNGQNEKDKRTNNDLQSFNFFSLRTKSPNSASLNIKIYRKITLIDPKLWKGWPLVKAIPTKCHPPLLLQGHSHQRSPLCSYKAIPTKGHPFALTRPFLPKVTPLLLHGGLVRANGWPLVQWPCKSKGMTFGGNGLVRAKVW